MTERTERTATTAMHVDDPRAQALLDAWFEGDPGVARPAWFRVDAAYDERLRASFGAAVERALDGDFEAWRASPAGTLALVLLLDQLPRNLFRGTPRAFAGDPRARAVARDAIARGLDASLPPIARTFFGLPMEHAEELALQDEGVRFFERLLADAPEPARAAVAAGLDYARRHRDIIARFGRFPHRNAILGRQSTAEEIEFLKTPGSSF